jgi:hypothetical protein
MPPGFIVVLALQNSAAILSKSISLDGDGQSHNGLVTHRRRVRHRPYHRVHLQGKAVDVREIGRELNVRYMLEGSVQRGDNRFA